MKRREREELKHKSEGELRALLGERRERVRELRLSHTMGKLKNVGELRNARKSIAVILTFLRQKLSV